MQLEHYQALYLAYGAALGGWLLALRCFPGLWQKGNQAQFAQPWRELGYAVLAGLAIIGIGQLYTMGYRLPTSGRWGPVFETINQALIFSPVWFLLWLRGQGFDTIWLPLRAVPPRILVGVALSLLALFVFTIAKNQIAEFPNLLPKVYRVSHARYLAQVFLEDVAIAMMMVRFVTALRDPWLAAIVVGLLFSAGHIPAIMSGGASVGELRALAFDFVLAAGVVRVLHRAADIWWFWPVHFTMDMTQFA